MTEQVRRSIGTMTNLPLRRPALSVRQPVPFIPLRPANGRRAGGAPVRSPSGGQTVTAPATGLHRLWLNALAEEERHVAPFERMATALIGFVSAVAVLLAFGVAFRLVAGWDAFVAFVRHLIA